MTKAVSSSSDVIADCEARLTELNLLAPHLPDGKVVERFLALISPTMSGSVSLANIERVLMSLAEDRERREEPSKSIVFEQSEKSESKPDAIPETTPVASQDATTEEPTAEPSPPKKYCEGCDKTKPLIAFRKHGPSKDGRRRLCIPCEDENRPKPKDEKPEVEEAAAPEAEPVAEVEIESREPEPVSMSKITHLPPAGITPRPEREEFGRKPPRKFARYCVNGEDCVSFDQIGFPQKLTSRNLDDECFACQEANHKTRKLGRTIVRKRKAG